MKQLTWNKSRGLTLTELLAVLMILSLLTTIAVPVYVSRQEDARVRVAMTETRQIADAEELVAAMHGFYVPFQLLDELPADPDDTGANDEERIDLHYDAGNFYLINPLIKAEDQLGNQIALGQGYDTTLGGPVGGPANPRARALVDNWSGPYITYHRYWYDTSGTNGYQGPSDPDYRDSDDLFRDFPLDPWGNPYRFYSPIGVIGDGDDEMSDFDFVNPDVQFSNGELTENDGRNGAEGSRFQRYAVVSFGRDGVSDTDPDGVLPPIANRELNDIIYEFGTDGVSRNFGKF